MKTLDGVEITYEMSYNLLESLRPLFRDGAIELNTISYCQDIISDCRLDYYPDIELLRNNSIRFIYDDYSNSKVNDHLSIYIKSYGFDYEDRVLSYYYIKGDKTESKMNMSWNDAVGIVNLWHSMD